MVNPHSDHTEITPAHSLKGAFVLTCHRFFAPVVFPEPDKLDPRRANIIPRMGNFPCIREKCMMWNADAGECWDVSAARGQMMMAQLTMEKESFSRIGPQGSV